MRFRRTFGLLLLATLSIVSVACQQKDDTASDLPRPSRAFCRAAANYDKVVSLKATTLVRHIALTKAIAATAPADAKQDAEIIWHSFEKLSAGDKSVIDNAKVKAAVEHVNRRAGQDCGWYRRKEGL